jgi:ABC-type polysaccharide/polyol phosphate export permease
VAYNFNSVNGLTLPVYAMLLFRTLPQGKNVLYKGSMFALFGKLAANRNLLKNLIIRDLKNRYVGSIGGFLWSVIHPVVLLISYTFIFSVVIPLEMGPRFGTDSFAIFILCGLLPWLLFSDTIVRNCSAISDNAPLITKTVIPAEILPISITISNLVHHLIGLLILFGVLTVFYSVHVSALWVPFYMLMLLMFAQGLGWIVAGLHVFVRDTLQAVQIIMLLWFYFTPVLYTIDVLSGDLRFLAALNPMALIVTGYRNSLLDLSQPGGLQIAVALAASIAAFVIGALFFRRTKPAFPDVL